MSLAKDLYRVGKSIDSTQIFKNLLKKKIDEHDEKAKVRTLFVLNIDSKTKELTYFTKFINKKSGKNSIISRVHFQNAIGGRGLGYFYLYPNFELKSKNITLSKNFLNIINSIHVNYSNSKEELENILEILNRKKSEIESMPIDEDCYFTLSVDDKFLNESYPEIFENWLNDAKLNEGGLKNRFDCITNQESKVSYSPEFPNFTYDNHHNSMLHILSEKLSLSKESASFIKRGWLYIQNSLIFSLNGLTYIFLPKIIPFDQSVYKELLQSIASEKRAFINNLKVTKDIEKRSLAIAEANFIGNLLNFENKKNNLFKGHKVYFDYIFIDYNHSQKLITKIISSINDVNPSRVVKVAESMEENDIHEGFHLKKRKFENTYLSNYFGRFNLFSMSKKLKGYDNKKKIEKIELFKLLLGVKAISYRELKELFMKNREYSFDNSKRVIKEGFKEALLYPNSFLEKEKKVEKLLREFNLIRGEDFE